MNARARVTLQSLVARLRLLARPFRRKKTVRPGGADWRAFGVSAARSAGIAAALLGIAAVLFVLALLTPPGRGALARTLEQHFSKQGYVLRIGAIDGWTPGRPTLREMSLADSAGPIVAIDRLRLDWSPLALLRGRLEIEAAEAGTVIVARELAPLRAAAASLLDDGGGLGLPETIRIGRASIAALELPTGPRRTARVAAEASFVADEREGTDLRFAARRTDGAAGSATLSFRYAPETRALAVRLRAEEAAGGILASLTGLPRAKSIVADADGEGTLDSFRLTGALAAGEEARAEIVARLARSGTRRNLRITVAGDLSRAVAADRERLFEGLVEASATVRLEPGGGLAIERLDAKGAPGRAAMVGSIEPGGLDLRFDLIAGDAARYAGVLPAAAGWERLRLFGQIGGSRSRPTLGLSVEASKLSVAGNSAGTLEATLDGELERPSEGGPRIALRSRGTGTGLGSADARFAGLVSGRGQWQLDGTLEPGSGRAAIRQLDLDLPAGHLRYAGTADRQRLAGSLLFDRVDLKSLAGLAGRPLTGIAEGAANIDAALDGSNLAAGTKASAKDFGTGLPTLDRLAGGELAVEGGFWWRSDGSFGFDKLAVRGAGAGLTADGRAEPQGVGVQGFLDLSDLGKVDGRLAGQLRASARFGGRIDALRVDGRAEIPHGRAFGRELDGLVLTATLSDLQGLGTGTAQLAGRVAGLALAAEGRLARQVERRLAVEGFAGTLGATKLGGGMNFSLADGPRGTLDLDCPALASLGALLPLPLAGNASAKLDFVAGGLGTNVRFSGRGAALEGFGATVRGAMFEGDVRDLFGLAVVRARSEATGVGAFGIAADRLRLQLEARGPALLVAGEGAGGGVEASGRFRLISLPDEWRIGFETLLLAARGEKITLPNPTLLRLTKDGLTTEALTFRAGAGEIVLAGRVGADNDLRITAKSVPLAWAEVFLPGAELTGTVSANASLAGPIADPRGRYEIAVDSAGADVAGAERISGRIGGDILGRRTGITATLTGGTTKLAVEGSAALAPGPVDLGIKGRLDLVTALAPIAAGAKIAGTASIDARIGGTLAAPRVTGAAELSGGAYRNGAVDFGDAAASLSGAGDRIDLVRFDAKLAGGGKFSAYGPLHLDAGAGFPLALKLDLDGARIGRGELVTAIADAALNIEGPVTGRPDLRGLVALRGVELRIPDPPIGDAAAPPLPPLLGGLPVEAHIKVVAPNRVLLRGRGVEAELGGEVFVTAGREGTTANGELELRRGYVGLADMHVPLTGGRIVFSGPIDPKIFLVALARDVQGAASLVVEGPLSDPGVRLVSAPAASDAEMVMRLLSAGSGGKLDRPTAVSRALDDLAARGAVFTTGAAGGR